MTRPREPGPPPSGRKDAPRSESEAPRDADVHAFLIADVRGYTSFTQERGDEQAARLAARFAGVAREIVEANGGRVLELRGDEALAVFGSPRAAIRAAVACQQRFVEQTIADTSLPLTVGIGIDAGEAVPVEGGYRGAALNVAARLCSLARAGEVLASRELVHLARLVEGVSFAARPDAEVKGIDKPLQVVAIRAQDRDAAKEIAPFVRPMVRSGSVRRWWTVGAIGGALAVITALIATPILSRDADAGSEIEANSIGVLDPETGEVIETLEFRSRPGAIAASSAGVWVAHPDVDTVTRIDPKDRDVMDSIPVGEDPTSLVADEDAVWVVESGGPSVSRISPDTNTVVDTIGVGNGPSGIAVGAGSVWVTNRFDGTLSRIDPVRGEVVETIPVGLEPRGVVVGFGGVWVSLSGSNSVVRVDPETNTVTQSIGVGSSPGPVAVTPDSLWVVNVLDDTVSMVDPDIGRVTSVLEVGDGPAGIVILGGTVWVANEAMGQSQGSIRMKDEAVK